MSAARLSKLLHKASTLTRTAGLPRVTAAAARGFAAAPAPGKDKPPKEGRAEERARHADAMHGARWASSWMMPWERAQMDAPVRPLKLWERVYWRLFVVLGAVGLAHETWVLGNRRVWVDDPPQDTAVATMSPHWQVETTYRPRDIQSGRLLSDDEVGSRAVPRSQ